MDLSGNRSGISANVAAVNLLHLENPGPLHETKMKKFWDLEAIGIKIQQEKEWDTRDAEVFRAFHDSFRTDNCRRVISLPKKKNFTLPTNRQNNEEFQLADNVAGEECSAAFRVLHPHAGLRAKGQVEEVNPDEDQGKAFYLPHNAVSKGRRGDTKWRIVFDASSHEKGAPSLNDVLEMGPNLLPEVFATLLRFRLTPVAITVDISQTFLQLQLDEKDRDLKRFLWYPVTRYDEGTHHTTDEVICYQFTRLPFGLTCIPFHLSALVRELAAMHEDSFPTASTLVDRSTFMYDFVARAEDDNDDMATYYQLSALMRKYNFPMGKWASNSDPLKNIWRTSGLEIKSTTQVVGIG
jgi:hypothetical protein